MEITLKNYKKLLTKIQQTISKTKKNIVKTVDYQKVLMSWEVGKEIDLHLKGQDKAEYGEQLFLQLTKDTGIEKTTLYKMRAFYKAYPKIPSQKNSLSWSHYRSLVAVKDDETRLQLENLVVEKSLGADRLQKEITVTKKKKIATKIATKKSDEKISQLKVKRGKLGTYTIKRSEELGVRKEEIDLGFNVFLDLSVIHSSSPVILSAAKDLRKRASNSVHKILRFTQDDKEWFTYVATLERVVDGDTIHAKIDLGFGIFHREIIRLAKINAAESDTAEGKKATAALKKILDGVKFLILRTNKTDIYGRYVADIFFDEKKRETNPQKVADCGTYLNQLLLDRGIVSLWQG